VLLVPRIEIDELVIEDNFDEDESREAVRKIEMNDVVTTEI
jgi:hypothetical protein